MYVGEQQSMAAILRLAAYRLHYKAGSLAGIDGERKRRKLEGFITDLGQSRPWTADSVPAEAGISLNDKAAGRSQTRFSGGSRLHYSWGKYSRPFMRRVMASLHGAERPSRALSRAT